MQTSRMYEVMADPEELAHRAAALFVMAASSSISARGVFNVAISGGSTPRRFLELLGQTPYSEGIEWNKTHLFFVDERCVPPGHEASNFRMAHEALLKDITTSVHRIEGELGPDEASRRYSHEIRALLGVKKPVLDMVLLGMGADGHTASLMPGSAALTASDELVVPVPGAEPPRVSMTLPLINASRSIVFHVAGKAKAATLKGVLQDEAGGGFVAALVAPRAVWLLDREAASQLQD